MDYISGEIFVSIPPSNLGFRWNEYWGLSSNGTEMYAKGVDRYLPEMRLRRIQE